jgi:hypothetical protein
MIEDEEAEEMSHFEKSKLPYVLLLDRAAPRAAAYTNTHRLITPDASDALIAFALAHPSLEKPWDEQAHNVLPSHPGRELPDWATPEVRQRCVLLWIERGNAPDEYWRSIPKK